MLVFIFAVILSISIICLFIKSNQLCPQCKSKRTKCAATWVGNTEMVHYMNCQDCRFRWELKRNCVEY